MEVPECTEKVLKFIIEKNTDPEKSLRSLRGCYPNSFRAIVCRIKKSLYGLKQYGRCWHKRIGKVLHNFGAKPTFGDASVYVKDKGDDALIIIAYVDDIITLSKNRDRIDEFYKFLGKLFQINGLGEISYCLGIGFSQDKSLITMSQRGYTLEILDRFGMSSCHPGNTTTRPGAVS